MADERRVEDDQRVLSALKPYWYPVCKAEEVQPGPTPVTVLGEDLVVVRAGERHLAFRDQCVHRGARLSLGHVAEGRLVCPYHGWAFDARGACVHVPALPADLQRIPPRAHLVSFRAEERYGLVWVALEEPRTDIPIFPHWDAPDLLRVTVGPFDWRVGADRVTENAMDSAHLPVVHPGLLGDPSAPTVGTPEIADAPGGFTFVEERVDTGDSGFSRAGARLTRQTWIHLPFTWRIVLNSDEGSAGVLLCALPVHATLTRLWLLEAIPLASHSVQERMAFNKLLLEQDRQVVESQRPRSTILSEVNEIHIRSVDRASLEYRRRLEEILREGRTDDRHAALQL